MSVLEYFQAHREGPLYQFLTWYLILEKGWRFEELARYWMYSESEAGGAMRYVATFTFQDKREETLVIRRLGAGQFAIDAPLPVSEQEVSV